MPQWRAGSPAPRVQPSPAVAPSNLRGFVETVCASSEPARDVILSPFVAGIGKDLVCGIELHHSPVKEEAGLLRHPGCLLHVVRNNHNSVLRLQLKDKVLD